MKKLLPILLALLGTSAGVGAGILLAPAHEPPAEDAAGHGSEGQADDHGTPAADHATANAHAAPGDGHGDPGNAEYVKLNNQFVVPVVNGERVQSLVVMSLSLETIPGGTEQVYAREPKLRDVFLRVLFDHANIGGFEGNFTDVQRLDTLRRSLLEAARNVMGGDVIDVLITEIARQDS